MAGDKIQYHSYSSVKKIAAQFGFPTPFVHRFKNLKDLMSSKEKKFDNSEGFVIHYPKTGLRVKVKSAGFFEMLKGLRGCNYKKVAEAMKKNNYKKYKLSQPEELFDILDDYEKVIRDMVEKTMSKLDSDIEKLKKEYEKTNKVLSFQRFVEDVMKHDKKKNKKESYTDFSLYKAEKLNYDNAELTRLAMKYLAKDDRNSAIGKIYELVAEILTYNEKESVDKVTIKQESIFDDNYIELASMNDNYRDDIIMDIADPYREEIEEILVEVYEDVIGDIKALSEASTSGSSLGEIYITIANNIKVSNTRKKIKIDKDIEVVDIPWNKYIGGNYINHIKDYYGLGKSQISKFERIADELIRSTGGSYIFHYGRGSGSIRSSWRGSNSTPKTDIYVEGNKQRFSLKNIDGSQWMSGGLEESISTFEAAVNYYMSNNSDGKRVAMELAKEIESSFKNIRFGIPVGEFKDLLFDIVGKKDIKYGKAGGGDLAAELKKDPGLGKKLAKEIISKLSIGKSGSGETSKIKNAVIDWFEGEMLHKSLTNKLNSTLSNNIDLKKWLLYEASTGEYKFTDNMSQANYLLKWSPSGAAGIYVLSNGHKKPGGYINKNASSVKCTVRYKSGSSKSQGTWSVLALAGRDYSLTQNGRDYLCKLVEDELRVADIDYLTEGVWSDVKDFISGMYNAIATAIENAILKFYYKIVEVASSGINMLLYFLGNIFGIELDSVDMSMPDP